MDTFLLVSGGGGGINSGAGAQESCLMGYLEDAGSCRSTNQLQDRVDQSLVLFITVSDLECSKRVEG